MRNINSSTPIGPFAPMTVSNQPMRNINKARSVLCAYPLTVSNQPMRNINAISLKDSMSCLIVSNQPMRNINTSTEGSQEQMGSDSDFPIKKRNRRPKSVRVFFKTETKS